jgi:hypothetical protein
MPCLPCHMRCSHLAIHAGRCVPGRVTLSNHPKNCSLLPGQVLHSFLIQQSAVTERYIEEGTDDLIHVIAINGLQRGEEPRQCKSQAFGREVPTQRAPGEGCQPPIHLGQFHIGVEKPLWDVYGQQLYQHTYCCLGCLLSKEPGQGDRRGIAYQRVCLLALRLE